MAATLAAGVRVVEARTRRVGTVRHVGPCGWTGCRHGDTCVAIWFDGGFTTENRDAATLEVAS